MKEIFLQLKNHNDLSEFFGLTYNKLEKLIYYSKPHLKYNEFYISKKNGKQRHICSPSKNLRKIQTILNNVLYEIYPVKPSAHGFVKNKSIVTNAKVHQNKTFILNIDLSDFFETISFGRVRNLFKSNPFNFNNTVSTILAQICCFNLSLPQGAPTSPIISNMIAWKLDSQLQKLAKENNCTYTRYADDITFSFSCRRNSLPKDIIDEKENLGTALESIIKKNGFYVNYDKFRFCDKSQRMEVTGLTVNEFVNVNRKYIKQVRSMLYAWEKHGYEKAEEHHNSFYNTKQRASKRPKSFLYVLKGKLAFLKNARDDGGALFNTFAKRFNKLVEKQHQFKVSNYGLSENIILPKDIVIKSLWIIVSDNGAVGKDLECKQGTGFMLKDFGIVTCAHVIGNKDSNKIYDNIEIYKMFDPSNKFKVNVEKFDFHQDIAICTIENKAENPYVHFSIEKSNHKNAIGNEINLYGFPLQTASCSHYQVQSNITQIFTDSAVERFFIGTPIVNGNSGGPVVDKNSKVVGIAQKTLAGEEGKNCCLDVSEIGNLF